MALKRQSNTFVLAYQTMGMVYGGLCTTPLYLYSSIPFQGVTQDDYLGLLSIIFWTLTLIGGVKYVLIVLHADDHGEGGTFALYSLLCRHVNISLKGQMQGGEACQKTRLGLISWIGKSQIIKKSIFCITMLATCMVMGDGILTPAISVLSAIEGLKIVTPSIGQGPIVIISVVLLVGLFLCQRFGTHHISFIFSPIIVTWLTSTPLIGLYNILKHYPTVYKAMSPYYMLKFFSIHGKKGWLALGGTTLCITGAEAMFADLGHFNKPSMQLGFLLGVYPSNIITYAGLTAYLINNPEHQGQAFYKFTPIFMFWPMFIVSTLAAIVASQGLISACFSLINQCVALDCFPRVKIIHTSNEHEGQVYSPQVNFSLMVLCIAIVIGFHNGNALGNAYGVAVIAVMLTTTMLLTLVMVGVWGVSVPLALSFFFFFTFVEFCNLSAVLSKVPKGGWLPFTLAILLAILVFTWVEARAKLTHYELSHSITFPAFTCMLQKPCISRVPGVCFLHTFPHSPMQTPFFNPSPKTSDQHSNHTKNHLNHKSNHQLVHSNNCTNHHPNQVNENYYYFLNQNIDHLNQHPNDKLNHNQHPSHNKDVFDCRISHVTCHTTIEHDHSANQIKQNECHMNHTIEVKYPPFVLGNPIINALSTRITDFPTQKPLENEFNPDRSSPQDNYEQNVGNPSPKNPTNVGTPLPKIPTSTNHQVHQFKEAITDILRYDGHDHIKTTICPTNQHSNQCLEEPIPHVSHASGTNCCNYEDNNSIKHSNIQISENEGEVGTLIPPLLQHYVQNTHSLHRVVILTFFHMTKVPEVPQAERFCFTTLGRQPPHGTPALGLYICTIHVGYAEPISEQSKELTWQLLEHLEDFIRTQLIGLVQLEGHKAELERATEEWEGHMAEVEKAKQDMGALAFHMVVRPKLKLHPTSNFLCRLALHKLYPLLQFYNPLSSFLSQVPRSNLLELTITYEV